jgi:hypothetical protein
MTEITQGNGGLEPRMREDGNRAITARLTAPLVRPSPTTRTFGNADNRSLFWDVNLR